MADKQSKTETRRERYVSAANRHDPNDPRTAASAAAPYQPSAGVVSEAAVERGQNEAGGVPELEFEPPADDDRRSVGYVDERTGVVVDAPAASSKSEPGNADADTGHKAEKLGTLKERTDRSDLERPAAMKVEGDEAKPATTDTGSSDAAKSDDASKTSKSTTSTSASKTSKSS